MRHAQSKASERGSKQVNLFGGEEEARPLNLPSMPEWRPMEKLQGEFEAIGFYLSSHPLDAFSGTLEALDVKKARDLDHLRPEDVSRPIKMAGTVVSKRERFGKRGNKYAFVALSDDTGGFEVMMFSEVLSESKELLESGAPLLLTVDAKLEDEKVRLLASKVDSLEKAIARRLSNLRITVTGDLPVTELRTLLDADGRGNNRIVVTTRENGHWIDVALPGKFAIQPKTLSGLKNMPGIADIREF